MSKMFVNNSIRLSFIACVWLLAACTSAHYTRELPRMRRQTLITSDIFTGDDNYGIHSEKLKMSAGMLSRPKRPSLSEYVAKRQKFIEDEFAVGFECDVELNEQEKLADTVIVAAKQKELNDGFEHPYRFNPARHQFDALQDIRKSELFQIIQRMPKGGVLHAHDMALCSTDFLVSLTYYENLWQCNEPNATHRIKSFLFSRNEPTAVSGCRWELVSSARTRFGQVVYDRYVRTLFTLYRENENPRTKFKDIDDVWEMFKNLFLLVSPILTYAPAWEAYIRNALTEMYADNVQYLEIRGRLQLYDLDGNTYNILDVMQKYVDILSEFQKANPGFIDAKFIYAPSRKIENKMVTFHIDIVRQLHSKFSTFLAGFDLVGQEDKGHSLLDFIEDLLELPEDINLFLHAGETNWYGSVDENLIDAILLGSKRIGHGYALAKHPKLLELLKKHDIAVEVNPVSNQVLKLVDDQRNHPAAVFFSQNIPLVVSSDDPSFWEATPLSHDFYIAFLGITPASSDLRTLKKLAKNSIKYSSMTEDEKEIAYQKWQDKWDQFIMSLIADKNSASQPA